MAKTFTKEDVANATAGANEKGYDRGVKETKKSAAEQIKAEIERVKQSDLSKPEQKAAIAALKNAADRVKSPIG